MNGNLVNNVDLLVIGGSGFVGAKVTEAAIQAGYDVAYTYASQKLPQLQAQSFQVKLQEENSLETCVAATQPRNIIYCAMPPPGSNDGLHEIVSVEGVKRTIAILNKSGKSRFIYVSTNAVFSGKSGPYQENALPDPQKRQDKYRVYAMTRAKGECIALESWPNTIVARTADVNGRDIQGKLNPRLANLVGQLSLGKKIARLSTAYISPTLVDNLVDSLLEIVSDGFNYRGILHLAGSQQVSYYDFSRLIARYVSADEDLVYKDTSKVWNISLDVTYTQSRLKTHLMNVVEQLSIIFQVKRNAP